MTIGKFQDLTGQRFGKLTVLRRGKNYLPPLGKPVVTWVCKCDCGNEIVVFGHNLRDGTSTSCGCSRIKRPPKAEPKYHYTPPKQPTVQDRLIIGETYTIGKKQLILVSLHHGFARFEDESGFHECYHYFDLEKMI